MLFLNEHTFSKAVISWLAERRILCQPVESGGVSVGIPDLFFSCREPRMQGWVELKNMGQLSDITKVPFRPGQLLWINRFSSQGTYCAVAMAHDLGISLFSGDMISGLISKSSMMSHCCQANKDAFVSLLIGDYFHEQEHSYWRGVNLSSDNISAERRDAIDTYIINKSGADRPPDDADC